MPCTLPNPRTRVRLIASIYDAALDSNRWSSFLVALAARLNSPARVIWTRDFSDRMVDMEDGRDGSTATNHDIAPAAMESFASYCCQRDVWTEDPRRHRGGQVVISSSL